MTEHTPNLPALIADLPGDRTRKPQTEFVRARQVAFLENLSITGSVRSASAAAGVSHQTAYRARRSQAGFRLAWDAAMVAARANADAVLAARAIDGVEEQVFYHGEVIATRTRYSDRLLLAHLARLDKLVADAATRVFADEWDAAMERFARGEEAVVRQAEGERGEGAAGPDIFAPGPCNTRSMSGGEGAAQEGLAAPEEPPEPPCPDCGGWCLVPDAELTEADCMWHGNRLERMDAARPAGVRLPHDFVDYPADAVEEEQLAAFEEGVEQWWLVVPPGPDDDPEEWCYAGEDPYHALFHPITPPPGRGARRARARSRRSASGEAEIPAGPSGEAAAPAPAPAPAPRARETRGPAVHCLW